MEEKNKIYYKIAEKTIGQLKEKCLKNEFSPRLFTMVKNGLNKFYQLESLMWMESFLSSENQNIASECLRCLCAHGYDIEKIKNIIQDRINDKIFSSTVIEIAEQQNKPEILIMYLDENNGYLNRVILALKKTNNESYLTMLMFSDDDDITKSISRMINNK